jgi:hypothetical protein
MHISRHVKHPLFSSDLLKLEFSGQIFEKYLHFIKIRPVGAESFPADRQPASQTDRQTDRQTGGQAGGQKEGHKDMTKLAVVFRNFANARKNVESVCVCVCLCVRARLCV